MKTYAQHRRIIDADSHLMELDDFLHNAARPEHLDLVPSMHDQKSLPVHKEGLEKVVSCLRVGNKSLKQWPSLKLQ